MTSHDDRARDRGLNAVHARAFAQQDETEAAGRLGLLETALQGGDLGEAAVRSQWTGEH